MQKKVMDNQYGFRSYVLVTDQISCVLSSTGKKCKCKGRVQSYDSFMRDIFQNALTLPGITTQLYVIIKICLIETYNKVRMGKYYFDI